MKILMELKKRNLAERDEVRVERKAQKVILLV